MNLALTLAQGDIAENVSPGVLGFLVIFAIGLALYFLIKSMRKQMRRIDFEEHREDPKPPAQSSNG